MAAINENGRTFALLVARLKLNTKIITYGGARVFVHVIPDLSSDIPCVLITLNSSVDTGAIGGTGSVGRLLTRPVLVIRGVADLGQPDAADLLADGIEEALDGFNELTGANGVVLQGIVRDEAVVGVETSNGISYYHNGGIYRAFVHQTPTP